MPHNLKQRMLIFSKGLTGQIRTLSVSTYGTFPLERHTLVLVTHLLGYTIAAVMR